MLDMSSKNLKYRLLEFISHKGLNKCEFEQICDLSNGFVDKSGNNTRRSTLDKISSVYPDLNVNWLLTGEGEMLKSVVNQSNIVGDNIQGTNVTVNKSQTDKFLELLKARDGQISKSQEQISKSQAQIDRLIGIIEKLNNI